MKCQLCHEHEAVMPLKQFAEGVVEELHVCAECAAKNGGGDSALALADIFFGMGGEGQSADEGRAGVTCPACHMRQADWHKTSRLGCPRCYETLAEELGPYLSSMHKGTRHKGKVPAWRRLAAEISVQEEALQAAVAGQKFEEAAERRDRLRDLKAAAQGSTRVEVS